jgi:hypothetical protein
MKTPASPFRRQKAATRTIPPRASGSNPPNRQGSPILKPLVPLAAAVLFLAAFPSVALPVQTVSDPAYGNLEEKRVIEGSERRAVQQLNQRRMKNHNRLERAILSGDSKIRRREG